MAHRWVEGIRALFSDSVTIQLRREQARRLSALLDAACQPDRCQPAYDDRGEWERLERLDKMLNLRRELRRGRGTFFTPPIVVVLLTGLALALLATHIDSVDVEVSARTTGLSFQPVIRSAVATTNPIVADALSFGGDIDRVEGLGGPSTRCSRIEVKYDGTPLVTLDPIELEVEATVEIVATDPRAVTLVVRAPKESAIELSASLPQGTQAVDCAGARTTLDSSSSLKVVSTPGGHLTLLAQVPDAITSVRLRTPMQVKALSFSREDTIQAGRPKRVSTLQGGTIYFEQLGDQHQELRSGQPVAFDVARSGVIELMELSRGIGTVRFRGDVSNLRLQTAVGLRSLMPTRLSWLMNRPDLALLYSLIASGLVVVLSVKKWLESRR
jgi:hypothetical protein